MIKQDCKAKNNLLHAFVIHIQLHHIKYLELHSQIPDTGFGYCRHLTFTAISCIVSVVLKVSLRAWDHKRLGDRPFGEHNPSCGHRWMKSLSDPPHVDLAGPLNEKPWGSLFVAQATGLRVSILRYLGLAKALVQPYQVGMLRFLFCAQLLPLLLSKPTSFIP